MGNTWMHGLFWLLLDDNSRRRFLVVEIGDLKIQAIRLDVWMICIMWFLVACAVHRRLVQDDTIQYTFVNMSSILLQVKIRRIKVWCLPKHGLEGSWIIESNHSGIVRCASTNIAEDLACGFSLNVSPKTLMKNKLPPGSQGNTKELRSGRSRDDGGF